MRVEPTDWRGRSRVDITASLPEAQSDALRRALVLAIGDDGATIREALGVWEGRAERAYTVERIGAGDAFIRRIVAAAIGAGCEAVQVERWGEGAGRPHYIAEEWRAQCLCARSYSGGLRINPDCPVRHV